jgi:hypothetical protein
MIALKTTLPSIREFCDNVPLICRPSRHSMSISIWSRRACSSAS